MQAEGLVVGGLGADSSKDLLERLTFDMLGLQYRYVTGYRSSNTARLALQNGEINVHSESTPGYFGVVEPSLVKTGKVMPLWYDADLQRQGLCAAAAMAGKNIMTFPEFYKAVKGGTPSGELWEAYKTNLAVDAQHAPPRRHAAGVAAGRGRGAAPGAHRAQRRQGLRRRRHDGDADSCRTTKSAPISTTDGARPLTIAPEMRSFITGYMKKVAK